MFISSVAVGGLEDKVFKVERVEDGVTVRVTCVVEGAVTASEVVNRCVVDMDDEVELEPSSSGITPVQFHVRLQLSIQP